MKTPTRKMPRFQNLTRQNLCKIEPTIPRKILKPTLIKAAIMAQSHHYWLDLWTSPLCNVFSSETHVIDFRTIWLRPSILYKNKKASYNDLVRVSMWCSLNFKHLVRCFLYLTICTERSLSCFIMNLLTLDKISTTFPKRLVFMDIYRISERL